MFTRVLAAFRLALQISGIEVWFVFFFYNSCRELVGFRTVSGMSDGFVRPNQIW